MSLERYILTAENETLQPRLNILHFRAILDAFLFDGKTGLQCRAALEWNLNNQNIAHTLTTNDRADITEVLQWINADGLTDYEKMQRADSFYRTLYGAVNMENSPDADTWFATQATMRAKFNWSDQD